MLLTNGRIHTMDAAGSVVDSLVIREDRVMFAGRRGDINADPGEAMLDLGGRAVLPGLVDGHGHLMLLAKARLELNLSPTNSEEEIAAMVGAAAARRRPGEWIAGRGWDQTRWPGQRFPTRASIDRAAPGHPVALVRVDGHATWASSAALARADVTRHTSDPPGGRIPRDDRGEPTGLLIDMAQELIRPLVPPPSEERFDEAVRVVIAECLAKGLTGAHEPGLDLAALASYTRLIGRGHFPFRVFAALSGKKAWGEYRERAAVETVGDGRLTVGAIKLWLDGALGSRGAALHAPYCDDPGNTGLVLVPPEEVERLTREATSRGFHVWVHASAIGPIPSCSTSSRRCGRRGAPDHACVSSTRRSSPPPTSRASPASAWCRACSPRTAPPTCAGRASASAPSASKAPMRGDPCWTRAPISPAAPTFPWRTRIRSTVSTRP